MVRVGLDSYGIQIAWRGELTREDLHLWLDMLQNHLEGFEGEFGVLSDAREVVVSDVVPAWAVEGVLEGQRFMRRVGMRRSAVILTDVAHCARLKLMARSLGRLEDERFLDPRRSPDWREQAVRWITQGVEPEGQFSFDVEQAEQLADALGRLAGASLKELLRLAREAEFIEGWTHRGKHVSWHGGGMVMNLPVPDAKRHLQQRLRAHVEAGHPL